MPCCAITIENIVNILGFSAQKAGSRRICYAVGCSNTEQKNPELQFYSFPGYSWQQQRREVWLLGSSKLSTVPL